jgi:tRNA A-37 threonylcarbamoyl transferase component Bud32
MLSIEQLTHLEQSISRELPIEQLQTISLEEHKNLVWSGVLHGQEVIIRATLQRNTYPIEIWAYQQYAQFDVPVPEIIYYTEKSHLGIPLLVISRLPGQPLATGEGEQRLQLFEQLGHLAAKIHRVKIAGFGYLGKEEDQFRGKNISWPDYLQDQEYQQVLGYLANYQLIAQAEIEALRQNFEMIQSISLPSATFIHGDLNPQNILIDQNKISGLIDPANGYAADPLLDIAIAHIWQSPIEQTAFDTGYGPAAQSPRVNQYLLWQISFKLSWRHQHHLDSGVQRAKQILAQTLRQQG